MGATCRAWANRLAPWILLLLLGAGCATSPLTRTDGGFRHGRHDYSVEAPGGPGPAWQRVKVEGAVLAYRRRGPDTMSLQSRCGKPVAAPQLMARHLVIRLPDRSLVAAGPIAVDGRNAWTQTFDTVQTGVSVRVKTVTLVALDCTFDFVLASTGSFEPAEQSFDAWWESFRLGPRYEESSG